jgi:RNA polymerase sigma factor (sigma-70 family)
MTDPEFALIDRILAGNQAVYAELVDRHKSYAFTIAYKILENRSDAEEAAQDAFIKAYHHLKNFKRDAKFSTWLYRIVFNTAVSYKRKRKIKFQDIETTVVEYGQEAEGILERSDKKKFIQQAMNKLNEADKLAISLFYLEEFSLEEIAEITGMQANTVKVRVHRARQRLAEELTSLLKKEALTL